MAKELNDAAGNVVLSSDEASLVEVVLGMEQGYVLDFTDSTFNAFVRRNWNLDATAPAYTTLGTSKANRLRGLLIGNPDSIRADVLEKFLNYRSNPSRSSQFEALSVATERAYRAIIVRLQKEGRSHDSSGWTGLRPLSARLREIQVLAPLAFEDVALLIEKIEAERANDEETGDALEALRKLHACIGELIGAIESQSVDQILSSIQIYQDRFVLSLRKGAKVFAIAPAMTLGVAHLLAVLVGGNVDASMMATVYASLVASDAMFALSASGKQSEHSSPDK